MYGKLGFTRDGVLREAYLAPDGRRCDLVLMALTKPEWLSRGAGGKLQPRRSSTTSAP